MEVDGGDTGAEKLVLPLLGYVSPLLLGYFAFFQYHAYQAFGAAALLAVLGLASSMTVIVSRRTGVWPFNYICMLAVLGIVGTSYLRVGLVLPVLLWLFFPPVLCTLFFRFRYALLWVVVSAFFVLMLFVLQQMGLTPVRAEPTPAGILSGTMGAIACLSAVVVFQALYRRRDREEREHMQRRLFRANKLESVARLAGGIAHDFNNLLGAVHSSLDFVERMNQKRTLDDAEVQACLADIRTAATRASEMTRRLLGFARRAHRSHEPVNISALASEVLKLLRRSFDRSIEIHGDVGESLTVTGDRSHLHQLLMNLCINARDAQPEGGVLSVRVRIARPEDLAALPYRDKDEYILVMVEDEGVGMDPDTQARLFEPFFTTKREGHGAGLGLATVYEVVDAHGGQILVDSEVGKGTCFSVYLPMHKQGEVAPSKHARPGARHLWQAGPPLSILLVDDEDVMRRSAARLLRQIGHEVTQATNGEEALQVYTEMDPKPDIVILDMDMPVLRGDECFRRLRAMDPSVRAVVVSGYVEKDLYGRLFDQGVVAVLDKPFEIGRLQGVLRQIRPRTPVS